MSGASDNPAVIRKARKAAKVRAAVERSDLRELASLPAGRRFLARLLCRARLLEDSWRGDPQWVVYWEGVRSDARWLSGELDKVQAGLAWQILADAAQEQASFDHQGQQAPPEEEADGD